MKWYELKKQTTEYYNQRGLADPRIRIRQLDKIESVIKKYYPSFIERIEDLLTVPKEELKEKYKTWNNGVLSGAASSAINEIYNQLQ
jgi:hypothetical protein